jgi:predicted nucleic acid-binding protein
VSPKVVLVETNWVVDIVAPAHLQSPQALQLLQRAETDEFKLYVPAICLTEARETVPRRFTPRSRSEDLRKFDRKPILSDLYDNAQLWVHADFLVEEINELPDNWMK